MVFPLNTLLTVVIMFFNLCYCDDLIKESKSIVLNSIVRPSQKSLSSESQSVLTGLQDGCTDELGCLMMTSTDRHGLEAIRSLHRQLDDDANGAVDLSESDDFLREELQYESGAERRQKAFHRNDDMHISVKELWEAWIKSEVHNWTVEQTTEWLASNVGLPQYMPIFVVNGVNGATLPRLAVSNMQYLSNILGIKDPIHKQKIALKAMDVVLFGPPKDSSSYVKDVILMILLLGATIGCWYVYRMNKSSRHHLQRMMRDMESLRKAELALENLQKELERARLEQESAFTEKQDLERKLLEQKGETSDLRTSYSDLEVSQLKAEIEMLRNELQRAEGELEDRCWSPPVGLQQWLQLTHEIENKAYVKKKVAAEKQLQSAREACEKLRKKRSSLVGAFVSTHGKSIDEVDRSIVEARTSLNEVTQELAERVHRWKQIELLCGFNIINNSGLAVLESILYKGTLNGRSCGLKGKIGSQDDLDEDSCSYSIASDRLGYEGVGGVAADSSESEKQEEDDDGSFHSTEVPVEFTLGDIDEVGQKTLCSRRSTKSKLPRSQSQDIETFAEMNAIVTDKFSSSETSLELPLTQNLSTRLRRPGNHSVCTVSSTISLDEEAYSTDSNSAVADETGEKCVRKSKLRFPKFPRKSHQTTSLEKHT